jgi:hypothetical protein
MSLKMMGVFSATRFFATPFLILTPVISSLLLSSYLSIDQQIKKAIKDYQTEIICYSKEHKKIGWAWFIPYNETDEDIVSDYSDTLTLNAWCKQFEELHKQLEVA